MKPHFYLALTHDWELRGNGSGDIEEIQFAPLRRLLDLYAKFGARTTFLPDVMQQIRFRQLQSQHSGLKAAADSWDEHLREAFQRGHDIQLHLHPQWKDGAYENGQWRLAGDWSILNYNSSVARELLEQCRNYLERLIQPIDAGYRCVAFRAGALAAAPSDHLLQTLVEIGITLEVSLAPGLLVDETHLKIDYRNCEETFLPFYPDMRDARRMSAQREPIVCVPLNQFLGSRRQVTMQNLALARQRISATAPEYQPGARRSRVSVAMEKLIKPVVKRKHFVADTSRLNYPLMIEMLRSIRRRAETRGLSEVPVVITNHPKDIRDWKGLERFVGDLANSQDIEFITLSNLDKKLQTGQIEVRKLR
jgi:hypothetical protein